MICTQGIYHHIYISYYIYIYNYITCQICGVFVFLFSGVTSEESCAFVCHSSRYNFTDASTVHVDVEGANYLFILQLISNCDLTKFVLKN